MTRKNEWSAGKGGGVRQGFKEGQDRAPWRSRLLLLLSGCAPSVSPSSGGITRGRTWMCSYFGKGASRWAERLVTLIHMLNAQRTVGLRSSSRSVFGLDIITISIFSSAVLTILVHHNKHVTSRFRPGWPQDAQQSVEEKTQGRSCDAALRGASCGTCHQANALAVKLEPLDRHCVDHDWSGTIAPS